MKKYTVFIKLILIISFVGIFIGILINNSNLKSSIELYDNNFKALNLENDRLAEAAIAYKFNIEQLEYINDSIIQDLNTARRELKIKDRELKQMQYIKTEISTRDSVFIKDTIFRDDFVRLDTVITDKWHTVALSLQPSKLVIDAKYRSELNVFASSSKEIVGTPKKCFIGRWFQKKYNVIRVDVKDNNPYSEIKSKKFVIIE
jgi:hypothetical protein